MRPKPSLLRFLWFLTACWVIVTFSKVLSIYFKFSEKLQVPVIVFGQASKENQISIETKKANYNSSHPKPLLQPDHLSHATKSNYTSRLRKTEIEWKNDRYNLEDKEQLEKLIHIVNNIQLVRNGQYTPDVSDSGIVVLVQVHKRPEELKILIDSLKNVRGIEKSLVIFSHDLIVPEINKLVEDINFCPVMQIFYPFSTQLYSLKGTFPADSKNDCPRDIGIQKAKDIKCNNADYPDKFKHYREAKYSQMKHHWLWKIHFVFNEIRILKEFKGMILRIDNDYYLAPDILHIMNLMRKHSQEHDEKMFIMGNHETFTRESYSDRTVISNNWFTGVGRGMAFSRLLWKDILKCIDIFCTFDDYNWDWSLHKVVTKCMKRLKVMKPKASRIFHVGRCHGFHKHEKCTAQSILKQVLQYLKDNQKYMFPDTLLFDARIDNTVDDVSGYGGWADPRDHKLCKALVTLSSSEVEKLVQSLQG